MTTPSLLPVLNVPRILLVDADRRVVQRLRLVLLTLHPEWDVELATTGEEALHRMDLQPFDVVVSDFVLPGMGGTALLGQSLVRHPETLRVLHPSPVDTQSPASVRYLSHYVLARPASIDEIAKLARWILDSRAAAQACA